MFLLMPQPPPKKHTVSVLHQGSPGLLGDLSKFLGASQRAFAPPGWSFPSKYPVYHRFPISKYIIYANQFGQRAFMENSTISGDRSNFDETPISHPLAGHLWKEGWLKSLYPSGGHLSPSFKSDAFRITRCDGRAFPQGLSHRMQRRKSGGKGGRLGQLPEGHRKGKNTAGFLDPWSLGKSIKWCQFLQVNRGMLSLPASTYLPI